VKAVGSCSSETEHNRSMAPRPELFVSASILQEQRPHNPKCSGLCPGEDVEFRDNIFFLRYSTIRFEWSDR
jgi:hypothetical protein